MSPRLFSTFLLDNILILFCPPVCLFPVVGRELQASRRAQPAGRSSAPTSNFLARRVLATQDVGTRGTELALTVARDDRRSERPRPPWCTCTACWRSTRFGRPRLRGTRPAPLPRRERSNSEQSSRGRRGRVAWVRRVRGGLVVSLRQRDMSSRSGRRYAGRQGGGNPRRAVRRSARSARRARSYRLAKLSYERG